jgi:hypothetical protein
MSAKKWVKMPNTTTIGTQTDPVSVSLKSRKEMGFKIHPKRITEYSESWWEEYWNPF